MTKEQAVIGTRIGTRILYRVDGENLPGLQEGKVKEITEGGNVKIGDRWHRLDHVNLVETLVGGVKVEIVKNDSKTQSADPAKN